ncbi:RING-H2 finger protein ATL54 [Platanthera guangdongensis]|uniref:RING-type E3 ubiquitin transferase n=1 Tax=Platanthera guangdongensis TaxID=2320717 RepID=A0ABR2M5I4_9ASPA
MGMFHPRLLGLAVRDLLPPLFSALGGPNNVPSLRSGRGTRVPINLASLLQALSDSGSIDEDETGGDFPPGGEIDHHIWYIRTQGLDDSTISSITSWVYKSVDSLIDGIDYSVGLREFHDGELVRLLPKCSRTFHLPCINMWHRSHVNCPLYRSLVLPLATIVVPEPSSSSSPLITVISMPVKSEISFPTTLKNPQIEALQ